MKKKTGRSHYDGGFERGRPMKGHGWNPVPMTDLLKIMAEHFRRNALKGGDSLAGQHKKARSPRGIFLRA